MNSKILITGIAGFLGTNLALRLLQNGQRVLGIDDLCSGSSKNLALLKKHPEFSFIHQDICNPIVLPMPIKQIYNLACPASPPMYQKIPLHTLKTCSIGIFNLLDLAKQHNADVLQASTSEVYGDPEESPQSETYWGRVNPVGPRACYDEGKRFAEALITNFAKQEKINCKIVRIFNTYGPHMRSDDGRVVSNFIMQALQNLPLTIYGDGNQTRSLCFVDDLMTALIATMQHKKKLPGPINLGRSSEVTVLELANLIIKLTASKSTVQFFPLPENDPCKRLPDTRLTRKILNWEATTDLEHGLTQTIKYFSDKL